MIDDDVYCDDVLTQIRATRSALNSVATKLLDHHMKGCIMEKINDGAQEEAMDELLVTFQKLIKRLRGYEIEKGLINVSGIKTTEQAKQLKDHLSKMIGINSVDIDYQMNEIRVEFDTPANLNNIEKEIYDYGFRIL